MKLMTFSEWIDFYDITLEDKSDTYYLELLYQLDLEGIELYEDEEEYDEY